MTESLMIAGLYLVQLARENEMTVLAWVIGLVGVLCLGLYVMRNWK
jgi:hypothetical protein